MKNKCVILSELRRKLFKSCYGEDCIKKCHPGARRAIGSIIFLSVALAFAACGDGSTSSSSEKSAWDYLNPDIDYGEFTDARDGRVYKTVTIGKQTWMAQNLNYDYNEGTDESLCYDNRAENCDKYGRLYTWNAAMAAVPKGWHLPTIEEWDVLFKRVGGKNVVGTKLKSKIGWIDKQGNTSNDGIDEYGFAVLPAGYWKSDSFYSLGRRASFWTATEHSSTVAYYLYSITGTALVYSNNCYKTGEAHSVRLVKD